MKRIRRSIILCLLLLFTTETCFAVEPGSDNFFEEPTQMFIETCNSFFDATKNVRVIDKDGNDISEDFYNSHVNSYLDEDYKAIWDVVKQDYFCMTWRGESSVQPRLVMNGSVIDYFYIADVPKEHNTAGFEMSYSVSGAYQYNDYDGTISSCGDAVLNIEVFNCGSLFDYEIHDISTN